MSDQTDMLLFLSVVERGSFSAAARALGQTPSAVGKRIRLLEMRLGVDLLVRSTRTMTLTEAGRRFAEEAGEIVARITALEEGLKEGATTLRGTIRVTAPTALGQRFVVPAVTEFMLLHPAVEIEMILTDKVVDLIGDRVDLAIRTGTLPDSSLVGRRVGPYRRTICAAPAYLELHGTPLLPSDLTAHRCLTLPHEKTLARWGLDAADRKSARLGPGLTCNSLDALATACLKGNGIACLPDFIARGLLSSGRLVPVLSDGPSTSPGADIVLLRPETVIMVRRVREFGDFLFDRLRAALRHDRDV